MSSNKKHVFGEKSKQKVTTIRVGSLFPCQDPKCDQTVRLFKDYTDCVSEFRCAKCLPFLEYSPFSNVGVYTNCCDCSGQFLVKNRGEQACYKCFVSGLSPFFEVRDPKPKPTKRPKVCSTCDKKHKLTWRACPYQLDIHNRYVYAWTCDDCDKKAALDI